MSNNPQIPAGAFTRRMARAAGLTEWDLRRSGLLTRVGSDLYVGAGTPPTPGTLAMALASTFPEVWISHTSAAELWGIRIDQPSSATNLTSPTLATPTLPGPTLTAPSASQKIRRQGVTCSVDHFNEMGVQAILVPNSRGEFDQPITAKISSPARIWLELANPDSLRSAVALGDQLVREPRPRFEQRSEAFCTLEDLTSLLAEVSRIMDGPRPRGLTEPEWRMLTQSIKNLAHYSTLIRVGADSPPETHLRLALMNAGLPEPSLQYPVMADGKLVSVVDLAYPAAKIALHYDGSPHLSPEALARDVARDNTLTAIGWTNIRADRGSYREGFRTVVAIARRALARAA